MIRLHAAERVELTKAEYRGDLCYCPKLPKDASLCYRCWRNNA